MGEGSQGRTELRSIEMQKLTPKEAVRAFCTQCLGMKQFNTEAVRDCEGDSVKCLFFPHRLGKRPPVKIFRKFCLKDCMNGYRDLVATCTTEGCPNYPYRFGTNPSLLGRSARGVSLQQNKPKGMVVGGVCV